MKEKLNSARYSEAFHRSIQQCLSNEGVLSPLIQHAQCLKTLDSLVQPLLPEGLQGQCQVMNCMEGRLVLGVKSPAWATKLRFAVPTLLADIQERQMAWQLPLAYIQSIEIKKLPA